MNEIQLIGRWTKEHDLHFAADGKAVLKNTIAVNRKYDRENADFLRVVIFGKTAQVTADHTSKGSRIGITGRVQTGSYEGQDGKRIFTTDVIANDVEFLEPRANGTGGTQSAPNYQSSTNTGGTYQGGSQGNYGGQTAPQQTYQQQQDPFANSKGPVEVDESDLPF